MKAKLILSMVAMSAVSLTAAAEDFSWGNVTFQPRAYMGYADYELKSGTFDFSFIELDGSETNSKGPFEMAWFYKDKIPIKGFLAGIGGTVATGRFFSDFYYQSTPNDTAYSSNTIDNFEDSGYTVPLGSVNAKHSDWAISLGYIITDQWSVFAGYKSGNTEWDQGYQFDNPDKTTAAWGKVSGQFDQDGPFLGTSYSFPIGPGALTIKAAYAYLDGKYKWENRGYDYRPELTNYGFEWDIGGNSNAYSLGISWTQSLTEHLGYSFGANYHKYEFDVSGSGLTPKTLANYDLISGQVNSGSLTEELLTLTASIFYRF